LAKRNVELKYGDKKVELHLEDRNMISILSGNQSKPLKNPSAKLEKLLTNPIHSPSLEQLLKDQRAQNILVIVNDVTRPTPYHILLPLLLEKLGQIGISKKNITFMIATGMHRGNTEEENKEIFGGEVVSSYPFINHNGDADHLLDVGKMKSGNRLFINPIIQQIDCMITTGVIVPHYIAGFSGGRKSILPGICGRETIENNHANMVHPKAFTGNLIGNPVHEEMMEAARKIGQDVTIFNINVITDENGDLIDIVAGELEKSWLKGVEICQNNYFAPIPEKADVVFVSTGGYPKDINVYQAQKALENAYQAVKPGGTIVLLAECREGLGNSIFEQWMEEAQSIEDIEQRLKKRFVLGGHKAYAIAKVAKEVEIILISSLSPNQVKKLFMRPAKDIRQAITLVQQKHGDDFKSYVIPFGSIVVPSLK
jgi:lactate racemase